MNASKPNSSHVRVVLGVTGGIAAFRAADLVSVLRERGAETRVAMTRAATHFVTPLTFAALTGHSVLQDELDSASDGTIPHIEWARWAQVVVVAPATADFLARLANGFGEDPLGCMLLALDASVPVVLAPAMNTKMWENPLVQANLAKLAEVAGPTRYRIVAPIDKRLACGEVGVGGLAPSIAIADAVLAAIRA